MTAQASETLIHEGEKVEMCSLPLEDYFRMRGETPNFKRWGTACYRGYVGTWEISDGRLFLVKLSALTEAGDAVNYLETLFPESPERVFAHWYTDTIRLPQGKLLEYVHHAFASTYERDLFIEFDKGVVVRTYTRENEVAPKQYPSKRRWISRLFGTA